jgi:uncharacterized repeat protein (TIGR01451 family)
VGPIYNMAYISDDSGASDQDDELTSILPPQADLLITKSDDPDPAIANGTLVYTLIYTNAGPSDAQNVDITETLPVSVSYGGIVSQPPGWSDPPAYDSGPPETLTWHIPTLVAGATGRIVLTVTVGADVHDVFTNSVTISSTTPDPDLTNNSDDEPTSPPRPDITVIKSVTPTRTTNGRTVTYTLLVLNSGGIPLSSITLTDTLPPGLVYANQAVPAEPDVVDGQIQVWDDITYGAGLAAGSSLTVTFQAEIDVGTGVTGTYVNNVVGAGAHPGGVVTDGDDAAVVVEAPYAVELVHFQARRFPSWVLVEWETQVEVDHYGFYLLRSPTPYLQDAVDIAFVPAAGHKQGGGAAYAFKDVTAQLGVLYMYWLIDVDINGQQTVHDPTMVSQTEFPYTIYLPAIFGSR